MSNYVGRGRKSSSDSARAKTETITFRLPVQLINELRKDAELEKVNLNAFVTRIFANHVEWERYERKMGLLPMTKPFLKDVINRMNDDEYSTSGRENRKRKLEKYLYIYETKSRC